MIRVTVRRSGGKLTPWDPNDPDDADAEMYVFDSLMHTPSQLAWDDLLARITTDERILGGKPIIRGMRFAVEHIIGMLAAGDSADTILRQYPILEPEDIQACLIFTHRALYAQQSPESTPVHTA